MPDAVGWTPSSAQTNFSDDLRIVDAMGSFQSRDTCRVSGEVAHGIQKTMIRPLPSYSHPGEPLTPPLTLSLSLSKSMEVPAPGIRVGPEAIWAGAT